MVPATASMASRHFYALAVRTIKIQSLSNFGARSAALIVIAARCIGSPGFPSPPMASLCPKRHPLSFQRLLLRDARPPCAFSPPGAVALRVAPAGHNCCPLLPRTGVPALSSLSRALVCSLYLKRTGKASGVWGPAATALPKLRGIESRRRAQLSALPPRPSHAPAVRPEVVKGVQLVRREGGPCRKCARPPAGPRGSGAVPRGDGAARRRECPPADSLCNPKLRPHTPNLLQKQRS